MFLIVTHTKWYILKKIIFSHPFHAYVLNRDLQMVANYLLRSDIVTKYSYI
ncbi:hypothetical protein HanHA300_Chr06g0227961 [Helianthus annuus]|nr:hypothetical protein HanHA300_Chr06g0227961 [Helianthus annuus]KAJ0574939.1 hypothetical protein HanHA89_Chr06g0243911 [Helianthus annuus]KAJ0739270.1 hypothetical protein HanLR1_Chr06g0227971 [Helianthus annuus]KAJ0742117.1 hypothetical protein HanOQP8_Chr06g0235871 [Helianthus annuus]